MVNTPTIIKSRYNIKATSGLSFSKDNAKNVSRTQQHFSKDANINVIMAKYAKSGLLTNLVITPIRKPQFGDFSEVVDFQTMQHKLIEVNNYFLLLPAEIRQKFNNNLQELQEWIINPDNTEEAKKLGLIDNELGNIKYFNKDGLDVTAEIINTRGLYRNGKRVNRDGTPYVAPKAEIPATPESPEVTPA